MKMFDQRTPDSAVQGRAPAEELPRAVPFPDCSGADLHDDASGHRGRTAAGSHDNSRAGTSSIPCPSGPADSCGFGRRLGSGADPIGHHLSDDQSSPLLMKDVNKQVRFEPDAPMTDPVEEDPPVPLKTDMHDKKKTKPRKRIQSALLPLRMRRATFPSPWRTPLQ